jgi:hypothetical protein
MSVTFPLRWPAEWRLTGVHLQKPMNNVSSTEQSGSIMVAQRFFPLWRVAISTALVTGRDVYRVQSFVDTLRDGIGTVWLEPWPTSPLAYPSSAWAAMTRHVGGAFDGVARAIASPSAYRITLDRLPTAWRASMGDPISIVFGDRRSIHRIAVDATASAGTVTLTVEPELPRGLTFPRDVRVARPEGVFRVMPSPMIDPRNGQIPAMSFHATLVLD